MLQVAFYPSRVDAAYVDGEPIKPQAGIAGIDP